MAYSSWHHCSHETLCILACTLHPWYPLIQSLILSSTIESRSRQGYGIWEALWTGEWEGIWTTGIHQKATPKVLNCMLCSPLRASLMCDLWTRKPRASKVAHKTARAEVLGTRLVPSITSPAHCNYCMKPDHLHTIINRLVTMAGTSLTVSTHIAGNV